MEEQRPRGFGVDICPQCDHAMDPHRLLAFDPLKGGIILCGDPDCECVSTWGIMNEQPESKTVLALLQEVVVDEARRRRMMNKLEVT